MKLETESRRVSESRPRPRTRLRAQPSARDRVPRLRPLFCMQNQFRETAARRAPQSRPQLRDAAAGRSRDTARARRALALARDHLRCAPCLRSCAASPLASRARVCVQLYHRMAAPRKRRASGGPEAPEDETLKMPDIKSAEHTTLLAFFNTFSESVVSTAVSSAADAN